MRTSKCRWSPKQWPVQPTEPITWPCFTLAPLPTPIDDCSVDREIPNRPTFAAC